MEETSLPVLWALSVQRLRKSGGSFCASWMPVAGWGLTPERKVPPRVCPPAGAASQLLQPGENRCRMRPRGTHSPAALPRRSFTH